MPTRIHTERIGRVLVATLARPPVNALDDALIAQLHAVLDTAIVQLGKRVQKQVSPMRSTVTPSNHRRLVAAALAQRLVRELCAAEAGARAGA